jgi:phage minor structural protein, N-terminal domain protein
MAYPILYKANETNFEHLGVSVLSDASKCFVTRERNGIYTLEFDYSINGKDVEKIKEGMLIKCDAGHRAKNQRFIVSQITKSKDGYKIYCKHISQVKTAMNVLNGEVEVAGTATYALETWKNNLLDSKSEFLVWSDILTSSKTKWTIDSIENAREALGGKEGSILDVWGGEYEFDNLYIKLHKQMGRETPTIIAYGKNLLDIEQEQSIIETYTSIFPFVKYQDEHDTHKEKKDIILTLPEIVVDSPHASNFTHRRILKVDFSSDDEIRTAEKLRSAVNSYIKNNNVGVPKLNLKLSYQDLSKVSSVFGNTAIEVVDLCDTLKVYYEDLGIMNENAKVIKVVWDVLLEENHELEIGDTRSNFNDTTASQFEKLEKQADSLEEQLNKLLQEQEAIFMKYFNEKKKEIEDSAKQGIEQAVINSELFSKKIREEFNTTTDAFREEVNKAVSEFEERFKSINGEDLNKLKRQIEETTHIAETTLKMVGTDDSITYGKNRVVGDTNREIPAGTPFIVVEHNGDGFEVGKEYTISWEAVCTTNDFYDIKIKLSRPAPYPLEIYLLDVNGFYEGLSVQFGTGEIEKNLLHVYDGSYNLQVLSSWFKRQDKEVKIRSNAPVFAPVEFKEVADGTDNNSFESEWSESPKYIFDGGN